MKFSTFNTSLFVSVCLLPLHQVQGQNLPIILNNICYCDHGDDYCACAAYFARCINSDDFANACEHCQIDTCGRCDEDCYRIFEADSPEVLQCLQDCGVTDITSYASHLQDCLTAECGFGLLYGPGGVILVGGIDGDEILGPLRPPPPHPCANADIFEACESCLDERCFPKLDDDLCQEDCTDFDCVVSCQEQFLVQCAADECGVSGTDPLDLHPCATAGDFEACNSCLEQSCHLTIESCLRDCLSSEDNCVLLCHHGLLLQCLHDKCGSTLINNLKPSGQVSGDPHFKSWNGIWFDYMGQCDLKMVGAPLFDGHQDLRIHIRTKIMHDFSYVEAAAIQIGEDVLEVAEYGNYAVNGVDTPYLGGKAGRIGGYNLIHNEVDEQKNTYDIVLGPHDNITLASYKNLVSVLINVKDVNKYFAQSEGILGSINGDMLSRSGKHMDLSEVGEEAFGQEWQITDAEPMLFRTARAPQYPAKCLMPSKKTSSQRRLGQSISEGVAKKACAHKHGPEFNNCVHDVMAIGDLGIAEAGTY